MSLDNKQKKVLAGMLVGACTALIIVVIGSWLNPFKFATDMPVIDRIRIAVQSLALPALCLVVAIGRIAKYRFYSKADIDGGMNPNSPALTMRQSLLQNTLEQFTLAVLAYLLWSVTMPAYWLSVLPLAGIGFAIGRVLFFIGYRHGAPARAIGFTLAFYTSSLMLFTASITMLYQILTS